MWNFRRKFTASFFSFSRYSYCGSSTASCSVIRSPKFLSRRGYLIKPSNYDSIKPSAFPKICSSFSSKPVENSDDDENEGKQLQKDDDSSHSSKELEEKCELERSVGLILDIIRAPRKSLALVRDNLEKCGVAASPELVVEVLSQVRNDWEAAFTFFVWAGKQPGYAHSLRQYHSMIAILAKMRKFDTAWSLIDEMKRGGRNGGESFVTPETLLIMIRRYCAVHDVGKAINTFYAHKQFNFAVGIDEFQDLLSALCRYKNVKEAEHLLLCNEDVYPLTTKSFNIILNGWCNVIGSPREGKRIWWEMSNRGIPRDVISYSSIITCYSKSRETKEVIKLFDELRAMGIAPDRKVYNAVIHALSKAGLVQKARNLVKLMEEESGIAPNAITYNSLVMPLCNSHQLIEARQAFHEMFQRGLIPTVRTYHAFFCILRTAEEVFSLLQKMNQMGCRPSHDTYTMLIRKFCRWRQLDNVLKLWNEMIRKGLDPDQSSYSALVHGLFLNGMLEQAYKYYLEMKAKDLLPEPEIEERLKAWLAGRQAPELDHLDLNVNTKPSSL